MFVASQLKKKPSNASPEPTTKVIELLNDKII